MAELILSFHPKETLDARFDELLKEFRVEWERHWGLDGGARPRDQSVEDEIEVRHVFASADRLVRAAASLNTARLPAEHRSLPEILQSEAELERESFEEWKSQMEAQIPHITSGDPYFWMSVQDALRNVGSPAQQKEVLFRTAVELMVFERFGSTPGPMASRALQLLRFLVGTQSLRAREYLGRVARCFILDLPPELCIMSRAVLEAALQSTDLEETVEQVRAMQGARRVGLTIWIEAASFAGLLDERGRMAAEAVRDAGDAAVHNAAGLAADPMVVLDHLKVALEQLDAK